MPDPSPPSMNPPPPTNNDLIKNCADMERIHRWPHEPWASAIRRHMMGCEPCRQKYMPFFIAENNLLSQGIEQLSKAYDSFHEFACSCGNNGEPGGGGAFGINAIEQICCDYDTYRNHYPEDANIMALFWLQKVFTTCRFFESQQLCEANIPKTERPIAGKMLTPEGKTYGEVNSLSYIMLHDDKFSSHEANIPLTNEIINRINNKEYYRALILICESPKHGVLSTIITLSVSLRTKQVYTIGFYALAGCINEFVRRYAPHK